MSSDSLNKNEINRYILESDEDMDNHQFNVLDWWRLNSTKYKILSLIARDIFAIPLSTVASESVFSIGGRILDPYRSSLTPKMVEALICSQNWVRSIPLPLDIRVYDKCFDVCQEVEKGIFFLHLLFGLHFLVFYIKYLCFICLSYVTFLCLFLLLLFLDTSET